MKARRVEARREGEGVMADANLSEDNVKTILRSFLENRGWCVDVAMGKDHGIDLDAKRDGKRWIIEAKGCGSREQMRRNYFLNVLGETLQRMDDKNAKYSIAFPSIPQYDGLWTRLPTLAKSRTQITILFVSSDGSAASTSASKNTGTGIRGELWHEKRPKTGRQGL